MNQSGSPSSPMNVFSVPSQEMISPISSNDEDPKPKPSLSSYNLFFKLERKRILEGMDQQGIPVTVEELRQTIQEHKNQGKRQHRKTHGKIGFRELARAIATRWKKLDATTKQLLEEQAQIEKEAYTIEFEAWKARNPEKAAEEEEKSNKKAQKKNKKSEECSSDLSQEPAMTMPLLNQENCPVSRIQALMHARAKIEAEMQALAAKNTLAMIEPAPIMEQPSSMPAFYAPVDTQETFSRNFFDHEEEAAATPKPMILDNHVHQQQRTLLGMLGVAFADAPHDANDLFQPLPAGVESHDFFDF